MCDRLAMCGADPVSRCECGRVGVMDQGLLSRLDALKMRMGMGVTVDRGYVCPECLSLFAGFSDSGHSSGTDVDISVYSQYYRHKLLKHVAELFPVIVIGPRVFHLSVRKDLPQGICHII